jgi:hypothetical protein
MLFFQAAAADKDKANNSGFTPLLYTPVPRTPGSIIKKKCNNATIIIRTCVAQKPTTSIN